MIKATIFDLNGVCTKRHRFGERFEKDFGIARDVLIAILNKKPDQKDVFEHMKPHLEKWGAKFTREEFYDYWLGTGGPDAEMIEIIKKLRERQLRVFALSNNLRDSSAYYAEHFDNLMSLFDKVYYSWQTGYAKPDIRAYENILEENKFRPDECLYFDDSEKNVMVASSLGIKSYYFKGAEETKKIIDNL